MDYVSHILCITAIYAMLTGSLELLVGRSAMLSVCHVAFYGIGAYVSALLQLHFQIAFLSGLVAGAAFSASIALVVSLPVCRLRDEYLVIATLAIQSIAFSVFNNWFNVTNGPLGVRSIPAPTLLGWTADGPAESLLLCSCFCILVYAFLAVVTASPFGRILMAIREDETLAMSLGKNTALTKASALWFSAACASAAGSLYAGYMGYIDPSRFTVGESILVICMVIVGGAGRHLGSLVGAATLVLLPEVLRFIGLPQASAAAVRQVVYGSLLVALMIWRPRGLLGRYEFQDRIA